MSKATVRPPGWTTTLLGDLGRVVAGVVFPVHLQGETTGEIPFYKVGDISEAWQQRRKLLSAAKHYVTNEVAKELGARPLPARTTVFAKIGAAIALNRRAILSRPSLVDNNVFGVVPEARVLDPEYLFYFTCTLSLGDLARATTVPSLRKGDVESLSVPLPALPEQRRIVESIEAYFTQLDDAVATLERAQRNLKRYRASVLNAAVEGRLVPTEAELARAEGRNYEPASVHLERILGERRRRWEEAELAKTEAKGKSPKDDKWKGKYVEPVAPDTSNLPELPEGWFWATWGRVSERVTVGHVGKMKDQYVSDGVPFLRGGNVRANRYEPADLKFVSREFHEELAKSALAPGDVLIVRSGAVGTSCVVPGTLEEANCSDLVIVKQPFGIEARFGAYYMNSLAQATVRSQQVGVALIHFNTKAAAALPVPVPPAREQERIVDAAEKALSVIDELETEVTLNLRRLGRLRQSILKWAFEGRLVDQVPTDEPASVLLERVRAERLRSDESITRLRERARPSGAETDRPNNRPSDQSDI